MLKTKEQKAITLITLVITIIVMLILAGVAINLILNQNGLFGRAKEARDKYLAAEEDEEKALDELYEELAIENLPENTPENPQEIGKEVALKDGWGTETVKYIKTSNGDEATELTKVATVYAVSVGGGETVPVPKGFWYVGGTLDNGVIISDNEEDKYEQGKDKTTYEYTRSLKGNQFVWIPCEESEYKKCNSWNGTTQTNSSLANSWWDAVTPKSELTQIEKYGGFYVGRYEAGLASTIAEFTTNQKHTGANNIYNIDGIPQSKAGVVPWMYIDWEHSKANAEKMYNNNYISSGLITGTQWDVILNKMLSKGIINSNDLTNSSAWGNYMNNSISYTGRLSRDDYNSTNSNAWTLKPFGNEETGKTTSYSSNNGDLLTTGASKETERYHIFDLAGNLWEWTEETAFYGGNTNTPYQMVRGGSNTTSYNVCSVSYRHYIKGSYHNCGFRTVLYVK